MTSATKTQVKKIVSSIKNFVQQADITNSELAEVMGINRATLACWLNGSRSPSLESITDFAVKMKAGQQSTNKASAAYDNFFQAV
jgi:transcriptional regulator with XRE-family HTH domain